MKTKLLTFLCLLLTWGVGRTLAQTDVTSQYLLNANFDDEETFDYSVNSTGNVAQEILEIDGWTKDIGIDYTITGIYAVGTKTTFNGASIPSQAYDGTANGGVLALSTGWDQSLKYYQEASLPAGKYALVTAFYNGCDKSAGSSLVGWIPAKGTATMSTLNSFPTFQWVADTVWFEISDAETEGKIQLGLKATSGGSANSAKVSLDYVKILYYGLDKSILEEVITEAKTVYGEGTGKGAAAFKAAIDEAEAVLAKTDATDKEMITAMESLKAATRTYQLGNASEENPLDMTTLIANPSFENGLTGWTQTGMQLQGNSEFTMKVGGSYLEKWTSRGSSVADCNVQQTVTGLENGVYRLKAGAQNLQQNNLTAAQSGVYLFAGDADKEVSFAGEYEVDAVVISGSLTIGFKAAGATGNWISVDNFRLYYIGNSETILRNQLKDLITEAETLAGKKMHSEQLAALNTAIADAKAEQEKESTEGYATVVSALEGAMTTAQASADAYAALQAEIDELTNLLGDGSKDGEAELKAAIDAAKALLATDTPNEELIAAIPTLEDAAFALRIANSTGTAPTVVTGKFVARGATMAFGRSAISGNASAGILEKGFCWSTDKNPTVLDNRSSFAYNKNGDVYRMNNLTPSTRYYVRAYAITKDYAVGYGDVVKIYTLPKGRITWWYNNGGDAEANARINAAIGEAIDTYWNHLTSINGLHATVSYGAQTETADCSYGGSMRVGPNPSYQRTGTIMHELGHAIGVGQHDIWYGSTSPLREGAGRGTWLGDRTTEVVRFLENNTTSVLSGDGTHMWPYGVNGAHEDTGSPFLYIGNSLITQALGEDGLPPTGGFATPAYVFDQEDTIKYYIKNEDTDCGLYSAYLIEDERGNLVWKSMTATEAKTNDNATWYITFTPDNQYYQVRNAGTGKYITYSNGFTTTSSTIPSTNEDLHLMRSRVDVVVGQGSEAVTVRGYWFVHPEHKLNPPCFAATTNGATTTATFDLGNSASKQRWVILQAEELEALETASQNAYLGELDKMIAHLKALVAVPHTETVEGTDAAINSVIASLEAAKTNGASNTEIANLLEKGNEAIRPFLTGATPTSIEQPFDISFLLVNAGFDNSEAWSEIPTINHSCAEFFEKKFDINQTVKDMPIGTYQVKAQGFQRPGTSEDAYNNYVAGTSSVSANLYIIAKVQKIAHIASAAQEQKLGGSEASVGSGLYIPSNMEAASLYFAQGLYDNAVATTTTSRRDIKVGIRCNNAPTNYWTIFDNFRLYYYGNIPADEVNGIEKITTPEVKPLFAVPTDIYSIVGTKVRTNATSLKGLPAGIYIVGGRKVIVR